MKNAPHLSITLPAGRYFIGDPCYVIADSDWIEFCDLSFDKNGPGQGDGVLNFRGHAMLAGGTAHGDGVYIDQLGNRYGVDAGMLGIVPEALWDTKNGNNASDLGVVTSFDVPFVAECCAGRFNFGGFVIDTDGSDDDDDVDYSDM